ncbi:hypothetical protein EDC01DRAFT_616133 [Geopyxis carbonaria]|nr:hypothetical protein EDC01DRAFT_616133 [Geopyxis carbonaria]
MLDSQSTLDAGYVFYSVCLILIAVRLYLSRTRNHEWRSDDYWTMLASLILVLRIVVIQYVLDDQTNNDIGAGQISQHEIARRVLGSKMILVGRTCYAVFLWCMKFCVLALYEQILTINISRVPAVPRVGKIIPQPSRSCSSAPVQLYTTGSLNIMTDALLIAFPLPMIFRTHLPMRRKAQISALFSIGIIDILISIFRMPFVLENRALQQWRTLFASLEMLASCIVATAPVLWRGIRENGGINFRMSLRKSQALTGQMIPQTPTTPGTPMRSRFAVMKNREDEVEFEMPQSPRAAAIVKGRVREGGGDGFDFEFHNRSGDEIIDRSSRYYMWEDGGGGTDDLNLDLEAAEVGVVVQDIDIDGGKTFYDP